MFRPHHPASVEFWLSLSLLLNLYNFLVQHDYISTKKVLLQSTDISLILILICMGLITSIFLRSRNPEEQAGAAGSSEPEKAPPA